MATLDIPQEDKKLSVLGCSACKQDHHEVKSFTDHKGWYFICPRTMKRVGVRETQAN